MKIRQIMPIAGLVAGTVVLAAPQAASAAVTVSSAGTTINVSITGYEPNVSFRCSGGVVTVFNGTVTSAPVPAVSCAALTQVTITGDSQTQQVDASGLNAAAFAAKPKLNAALGDGVDELTETQNADTIDLGGGSDDLILAKGLATNVLLQMGSGTLDNATLIGTGAADDITVASTGVNTTFALAVSGQPAATWAVQNVEYVDVESRKGDDDLDASGMTIGSAIVNVGLRGEDGNDTIKVGARPSKVDGGSGTNTINGGSNEDQIDSTSDTDVIFGPLDGADDLVRDEDSLRSGGRSITGFTNTVGTAVDTFATGTYDHDVSVRVRPGGAGVASVTISLDRMGQQLLPSGIEAIDISTFTMSSLTPHTLVDVVVPFKDIDIGTTTGDDELIDITIPEGTWTDSVASGNRVIQTTSSNVGKVTLYEGATYKVHGPWTNQNQGFGHRVYRDLLLRFATDAQRDAVRDQLTNGTKTRAQIVQGLINTDEYRGLDVDRVFLRYLRRHADSGGKTYWINSLENGKSLRQFRAQLFGSNEYFTKAGGTNATFVERAYEDVLGRKPDPSGQAYWTNKANNGTERGLIARQFLSSPEAKRTIVRDQFLRFLDRQPTDGELTQWTASLDSANGEQALIASLAASGSYFTRT